MSLKSLATNRLDALASRRSMLNVQQNYPSRRLGAKLPALQLVTSTQDSGCATHWIAWISERCPLIPEDQRYVYRSLISLSPSLRERMAKRYVAAWHTAAANMPCEHQRENAGRAAANQTLLAVI